MKTSYKQIFNSLWDREVFLLSLDSDALGTVSGLSQHHLEDEVSCSQAQDTFLKTCCDISFAPSLPWHLQVSSSFHDKSEEKW